MSTAALAVSENGNHNAISYAADQVAAEEKLFELAQRKAQIYSKSTLVPKEYQGNIGNVMIAENMARRMGADTLMVMQNLFVVHGRPGWSAQFLIACFNSCGRFSAIQYKFSGEPDTPDYGCVAYCKEYATGETIEGTKITWAMANAEGWVNKNGSKWRTMPGQMFRYRAGTFLIRSTAPEIGMGLMTKEELEDVGNERPTQYAPTASSPVFEAEVVATLPAGPPVITEDQRANLAKKAVATGGVEKLTEIINALGFDLLAKVTIDKYDEIMDTLDAAEVSPVEEAPAPVVVEGQAPAVEAPAPDDQPDEALEEEAPDSAESVLENLKTYAKDTLREITGGKARETNELLKGRVIDNLSINQVKTFIAELQKIEADKEAANG